MSTINKINKKIANSQKSMIRNIDNYFQLIKIKGMILEEYVRNGKLTKT